MCGEKLGNFISGKVDHPRMCGEKEESTDDWKHEIGSPPHVRGKGRQGHLRLGQPWITPACAGKRAILFAVGIDF